MLFPSGILQRCAEKRVRKVRTTYTHEWALDGPLELLRSHCSTQARNTSFSLGKQQETSNLVRLFGEAHSAVRSPLQPA